MEKIILTENKTYSAIDVINMFGEYLTNENTEILVKHLTHEQLASNIYSFYQKDCKLYLILNNGESVMVTKNT